MKAQSEICAAFLGRTRATKNRPDQPLQPASARKRSRKVEDLVFQQQSAAAGGVDGGGDERQQSPVHGISLKLQEEAREHRMDFVPEVSAINTDHIEVDKETLDMLHFLEVNDLSNITQVDAVPVQQTFPFTQNMLLCSDFNDHSEQSGTTLRLVRLCLKSFLTRLKNCREFGGWFLILIRMSRRRIMEIKFLVMSPCFIVVTLGPSGASYFEIDLSKILNRQAYDTAVNYTSMYERHR